MGGNARKRRIVAASRNAAKEKAATKKAGPSTKVDPTEVKDRKKKQKEKEEKTETQPTKPARSKWTGKSPLDLLHEHLQKEKWTRARWREQDMSQDYNGKALYTWKVSLFHPKTEERLFFRTCCFSDKIDPSDTTEQVK